MEQGDLFEPLLLRVRDGAVVGEGLVGILNRPRRDVRGEPHGDVVARQPPLAVEVPMPETKVTIGPHAPFPPRHPEDLEYLLRLPYFTPHKAPDVVGAAPL